jgi:hypothetical protein
MDGEEFCLDCHMQLKTDLNAVNLFYMDNGEITRFKRGSLLKCPKCGKTVFGWAGIWILQKYDQSDEDWAALVNSMRTENCRKKIDKLLYVGS